MVVEQTGLAHDAIRPESRLIEDLQIDSLDLVELVLAIEETFDVTIPDDVSRLPQTEQGGVGLRASRKVKAATSRRTRQPHATRLRAG